MLVLLEVIILRGSDTIVAPATCITGSIGVIGGLLNTTKLQEKLGLNYDVEKTSPYADLSNFRDLTNEEKNCYKIK